MLKQWQGPNQPFAPHRLSPTTPISPRHLPSSSPGVGSFQWCCSQELPEVLEPLKPQNAAKKMTMPSVRAMAPPQLAQGIVQLASADGVVLQELVAIPGFS